MTPDPIPLPVYAYGDTMIVDAHDDVLCRVRTADSGKGAQASLHARRAAIVAALNREES